jgi:hypothetical protein
MTRSRAGAVSTALALGAVLASAAGALAAVKVDYDKKTDFSAYRTWSWRTGTPAPNPMADKRLREAIEGRLAASGMKKVDQGGDLEVVYHAAGENRIGVEKLGYKEPDFQTEAKRVTYVRVGTVMLDLVDAKTQKVVWRGEAEGVANPAYTDVVAKIDAAVGELFAQFPRKP